MYEPNRFLEKAVKSGNAYTVRGAITGIIQANPHDENNEVENAIKYAEENGISVFDDKDNPTFEIVSDESKWNSEYFASSVTYLQANFTPKRLEHVLEVSKMTHPLNKTTSGKKQYSASTETSNSNSKPVLSNKKNGSELKKAQSHWKNVIIIIAGIALVALVIAMLFSRGKQN